ncbi:MAG: THUMP domain-containing protein [Planctomycetota bacterium]
MAERFTFFATCSTGLEALLDAEIRNLKLAKVERQVGGVRFDGTYEDMARANFHLRTAGRILLRVARFEALGSEGLYAGAVEVPWENFLKKGSTLRVDAQVALSALDHSRFVEQRIKDAVVDRVTRLGFPRPQVEGEDADVRIHAHVYKDRVTLSLDSSGKALRKRGWRKHQGRAPLAETLAAAMVLHSGWDGRAPLIDPFCGTGTLLVEAVMWATGTAPGHLRSDFGWRNWALADERWLDRTREAADKLRRPLGKTRLVGIDQSPERVRECLEHLDAVGAAGNAEVEVGDARHWVGKPGWNAQILSNPPYGVRVGPGADLNALYRGFGKNLRANAGGYHCTLLTQAEWLPALDMPDWQRLDVRNGALECVIVKGDVPAV